MTVNKSKYVSEKKEEAEPVVRIYIYIFFIVVFVYYFPLNEIYAEPHTEPWNIISKSIVKFLF